MRRYFTLQHRHRIRRHHGHHPITTSTRKSLGCPVALPSRDMDGHENDRPWPYSSTVDHRDHDIRPEIRDDGRSRQNGMQ